MTDETRRVLVIGYGNPGRRDDGLGPALADRIEARGIPGVHVESDYQLQVEHAEALARHDLVVFADAAVTGREPFAYEPVEPDGEAGFSTHSVTPPVLTAMAERYFDAHCQAYVLAIRGYEFDAFEERLSQQARSNLDAAVEFLSARLDASSRNPHEGCQR